MMIVNDVHFLAGQEQYKDLLRAAARQRLIRANGLQQPLSREWPRKVANRLGVLMVEWGSKLQSYDVASLPEIDKLVRHRREDLEAHSDWLACGR